MKTNILAESETATKDFVEPQFRSGLWITHPSPSGEVMVSTIAHPNAAWVHGIVMQESS